MTVLGAHATLVTLLVMHAFEACVGFTDMLEKCFISGESTHTMYYYSLTVLVMPCVICDIIARLQGIFFHFNY